MALWRGDKASAVSEGQARDVDRWWVTHEGVLAHAGEPEGPLCEPEGMAAVAAEVKVVGEGRLVQAPVLVGVRREVGRELRVEERAEVDDPASAEEGKVLVERQRLGSGELELEYVVLAWVHVDAVDPIRLGGDGVVEGVVAGRGDDEHRVGACQTKRLDVDVRVLPGEAIDVRAELAVDVFLEIRHADRQAELNE
jgi:hypothetical protein